MNPVLKKLGYSSSDRVVILHMDDVGLCHAANAAYEDLAQVGILSAASVMVPCAWFPHTARYCRQNPAVDMGVHLTLTSEWDAFRWGALSTSDPASGLLDAEGYFHRTFEAVHDYGEPDAVQIEIEAQIERALAHGIDVTHIDTHMGSVLHLKFLPAYYQAALKYQIPLMIPRLTEERMIARGIDATTGAMLNQLMDLWEAEGIPIMDHLFMLPLKEIWQSRLEQVKYALGNLPAGLTHFLFHAAIDTPELRAMMPEEHGRVQDYETFKDEALRRFLETEGFHVIGYRTLRALMRGEYNNEVDNVA